VVKEGAEREVEGSKHDRGLSAASFARSVDCEAS
jgi:hypothetical protein